MTPRVVEVSGLAGAGKTTLAEALRRGDSGTTIGVEARPLGLAAGVVAVAPVLVAARLSTGGRWWTEGELRNLAYLRAWRGALAGRRDDGLLLMDHGPVFRLASLAAFGPPMTQAPAFQRWWQRTVQAWSRQIDTVIWLDAHDDVLLQRIQDREHEHRVRGSDRDTAARFLERYRRAYGTTLGALTGHGVPVVRIDTSTRSPAEVAEIARAALLEVTIGRSP